MSTPQPLSYGSSKTIIRYMKPNKRILLSCKCPTLCCAEKAVPLKLRTVKFGENDIEIGDTTYSLTFRRLDLVDGKFVEDKYSKMFEDVDRYGFRIPVGAQPGDIDFGGGDVVDRTEAELNRAIERFRVNEQTPDKNLVFEAAKFQYRRKRLKPPYKFVICLSVGHNDELLEYTKPLRFAQKYLIKRIFENREASNQPVEIRHLHLCAHRCIRFPEGLKLKTHYLSATRCLNNLDEQIRPILTDCSFPLASIGTFSRIGDHHHPMIDSALEVKMNPTEMNQETVATLTHNRMHFKGNLNQLKDSILMIIENWQQNNRIVGTHFSFNTRMAKDVMSELRRRVNARTVELPELKDRDINYCLIFPIDDTSEISIQCPKDGEKKIHNVKHVIHMKVQMKTADVPE